MTKLSAEKQALLDAFQKHVDAELRKDLTTTLATMTANPHINNIPTMIGGEGLEGVRDFYSKLILTGKFFLPEHLEHIIKIPPINCSTYIIDQINLLIIKCDYFSSL